MTMMTITPLSQTMCVPQHVIRPMLPAAQVLSRRLKSRHPPACFRAQCLLRLQSLHAQHRSSPPTAARSHNSTFASLSPTSLLSSSPTCSSSAPSPSTPSWPAFSSRAASSCSQARGERKERVGALDTRPTRPPYHPLLHPLSRAPHAAQPGQRPPLRLPVPGKGGGRLRPVRLPPPPDRLELHGVTEGEERER